MRLLLTVCLFLLVPAGAAAGATIRVPRDHAKIQDAVDAARPGDRVLVETGTYAENVAIENKRRLTLIGIGDPTIDGGGGPYAVGIAMSSRIRITGFGLEDAQNVVHVDEATGVTVLDCRFRDASRNGVLVEDSKRVAILRNTIEESIFHAVELGEGATRCRVVGNTIRSCGQNGIRVHDDANSVVANDIAHCGNDGISIWSARNRVLRNIVSQCSNDGIEVWKASRNLFLRNVVSDIDEVGFQVEEGTKNRFVRNTVTEARSGGFWVVESGSRFVRNRVDSCSPHGIWMETGGNRLVGNRVGGSAVFDIYETDDFDPPNVFRRNVYGTSNL